MKNTVSKKTLAILFACLIVSIAGFAVCYLKKGSTVEAPLAEALPEAAFFDAEGKRLTLADFKGKTVLVNLWATWCPPCVAELRSLDILQAKLRERKFEVVAISLDRGDAVTVAKFLSDRGAENLKVYQDKEREIAMSWKYAGVPVSFLIGPEGNLLAQYDGALEWHQGPVFDEVEKQVR